MWMIPINTLLAAGGDKVAETGPKVLNAGWETDAQSLLYSVVNFGLITIGLGIVICLFRLLRGPSLVDRGVASDALSFQVVGLAILITIRLDSIVSFDAVLIIAFLGFIGTIAFAQYIGRRRSAV